MNNDDSRDLPAIAMQLLESWEKIKQEVADSCHCLWAGQYGLSANPIFLPSFLAIPVHAYGGKYVPSYLHWTLKKKFGFPASLAVSLAQLSETVGM